MKLAVDIETRAGHIACVGIAWNERDALCIPLMCVERPAGYWSEQEEAQIAFALYQITIRSFIIHNRVISRSLITRITLL